MTSEEGGRDNRQTTELPRIVLNRLQDRLSGMETLDLSVAEPEPTDHLALGKGNNARFRRKSKETPQGSAWQIGAEGDELELILTLPYKHGVNLILELCRTEPATKDDPPVVIVVNDEHEWGIELDPNNLNFQKQAWYLPQSMQEKGKNRIALKLAPKAGTEVLLRSASVMRFDLQPQEKTNWCWAAVTASLNKFFANGYPIRQDQVVNDCREDLEDIEVKGDNQTLVITKALDTMDLRSMRCYYAISLDEIRRQMQLGLPVPIHIEWKGGGGHYVVITGVGPPHPKGDSHTWLRVADPNVTDEARETTVPRYITYNALKTRYRGNGEWTHTYLFEKERERGTRR